MVQDQGMLRGPPGSARQSGIGAASGADIIYRSERTIVLRVQGRGARSIIRKELLGPNAMARMQREARILERLEDVAGVSRLIAAGPGAALALHDSGARPLGGGRAASPAGVEMAPGQLVEFALQVARTLAEMHRRGVLHLDISPANLLLLGDGAAELIDFDLATVSAGERRGFTHHADVVGTLAYIAPELTGRFGSTVDHRADFYAFGATLYELATGSPPFGCGDALQLIRDHIATLPVPPAHRSAAVPAAMSDIILRLLEKEPDRRYQSGQGLVDDLERLSASMSRGAPARFTLGQSDFPLRLEAPSRLVGRAAEIAALHTSLANARAGRGSFLLVGGAAGVGKTALVDQLRPIVAEQRGWFVTGQYAPGPNSGTADAIVQILQGILALLLAEPEDELAAVRDRLRARLGGDAALLVALLPAMQDILGAMPAHANPTEVSTHAAVRGFVAAVASPARPLVIAVDDLQWASPASVGHIGQVMLTPNMPGLLLVVACRTGAPGAPDPIVAALPAGQLAAFAPPRLLLDNLTLPYLADLLAEMLRLPGERAKQLAGVVHERTGGNPADTLDLLNALRRDRTLTRGALEWHWDAADIRRHVGEWEAADLLRARVGDLPGPTRQLLTDLASLGSEATLALLSAASGLSDGGALEDVISPALEDGLVVLERGGQDARSVVRFRNEKVQQAALHDLDAPARLRLQLTLARRLAPVAAHAIEAADHYLQALDLIDTPSERLVAGRLLMAAAAVAARTFRHGVAERQFGAAITLLEGTKQPDAAVLARLWTARLTALYSLGRYDEGDAVFASLPAPGADPLTLAEANCVQVLSLTNRGQHRLAMSTGLAMLATLGLARPVAISKAGIAQAWPGVLAWALAAGRLAEPDRVSTEDPRVRKIAKLINRLLPPAQLIDPLTGAWLALESQRLWMRHGVCPELVANLARSAAAPQVFGQDYRTGYEMGRLAVAVGAARGYEPEASLARQNVATFALHWFERLENTLEQAAVAHAGLVKTSEIQAACINFIAALAALFDCAETLEAYGAEIEVAQAFTLQTGNQRLFETFHDHALVLRVLTGAVDGSCLADEPSGAVAAKPLALFSFHCSRGIIALLLGRPLDLARHSASAMVLLDRIGGAYRCSVAALLRALSLAETARTAEVAALPDEFGAWRAWFAARAADAPSNFEHLLHYIDAEAAWTLGETDAAMRGFDRALQCCAGQTRPWHQALIAERAGQFYLALGMDYIGRKLLRDAAHRYRDWGAVAVLRRMTDMHGFLGVRDGPRSTGGEGQSIALSADAIDLLAILRASQALSSQTSVEGLHARLVETLSAMTGATACNLVIWDDAGQSWCLPPGADAIAEPVEAAAGRGALPISVFRYVERTRTPLLVDDAKLDGRFARDAYFAALERCSLLVLPVQSQGTFRAVLMLENRLKRGVFSHTRLDLVGLVAGQLAVSLDNAQLYASLERRVADRTEALAVANRRLELLSLSDGLTGLANRRCFDEMMEREWLRGLRAGTGIGLVILDIDHFKLYNDHYGHIGGDFCLRAVATALHAGLRRDIDLAARYGGEEFALVLPGAAIDAAEQVARRAHAAVLSLQKPHAKSPFGVVTVSVGVAALVPDASLSIEGLIATADAALYGAKRGGRNRVMRA